MSNSEQSTPAGRDVGGRRVRRHRALWHGPRVRVNGGWWTVLDRVAMGLAAATLVAGAGAAAANAGLATELLLCGAALTALAAVAVLFTPSAKASLSNRLRLRKLGARLERGIEQLKDLQWELRDHDRRYRDLLDSQSNLITRRDETGRITFANRAFGRTFGVETAAILGTHFRPEILEHSGGEAGAGSESAQRYEQKLTTTAGPRWFAFEQHAIPDASGRRHELQCVGRDITEARQAQADLASARDQAQSSNQAKSRFLAAMSHEIRTPMNGILGMSALLMDTELTSDQKAYAGAIDTSAKSLLSLIDEILDFSKIEAGRLEIVSTPFRLDECLQGAIELLAPKAREKDLELAWSINPDAPRHVIGDDMRLRQVLLNLIGNAIKFTDTGGIVVRATAARRLDAMDEIELSLAVTDTGIGISADALGSLFVEFEQNGAMLQQHRGGTGLGLAISRRLARAMGGDILAQSELGRGSTFTLNLPLRTAAQNEPVLARRYSDAVPRVLLALQRPLEQRVLKDTLESLGAMVVEVDASGAEAMLEDLRRMAVRFDAVIADAEGGHGFARELLCASRAGGAAARGIVLIGISGRSELPVFRRAGFDAYLMRPVRPRSLLAQVEAALLPPSSVAAPTESAGTTGPARKRGGTKHVLLVEDNDINALLATRMLERSSAAVVPARNGCEAIAHCQKAMRGLIARIDLVLMDIHMPKMDGFEALRQMKQLYDGADISVPPVVALTANAFVEDRKRCLESGFDDYLAKPFDRNELDALLDKWCGDGSGGGTLDDFAA